MPTVTISEARLNDLVYLTLKKFFFEPTGTGPRGCDIRICMDMACPTRIKTFRSAILLPNETPGKSHTTMYEVDIDNIAEVVIDYLEDHWMKQTFDEAYGKPVHDDMIQFFKDSIVPACMSIPEEQCGG